MVSAGNLISKSFILFSKLSGIVPSALITIGITVTFMFHSFFNSLAGSWYLLLLFLLEIFLHQR